MNGKALSSETKTQYARLALDMCNVVVNDCGAEFLWRLFEEMNTKGDLFDVRDAAKIKAFILKKYEKTSPLINTSRFK